ncbi:MAG TPA: YihY/virulence factor BrkB family protein [Acetobacteraceae bacterium]|nr:YihY/virulence factor BrkB family protein [Acetobacteraceae bacterium]
MTATPQTRPAARRTRRPAHGWRRVLRRTAISMISDRMSLVAAGCAFYSTLSLFPAITMLISIYGLVFNRDTVEPQLTYLHQVMPPAAFHLIAERVHQLVTQQAGTLGAGLAVSLLITLWSAESATKSVLYALNVAYDQRESRGVVKFQLIAFIMTLGAIMAAVLGLAVLVGLPAVIAFLGLTAYQTQLLHLSGMGGLLVFILAALLLLYGYGPSRPRHGHRRVLPGAIVATVLWLAASVLFSLYVGRFAAYNVTYGPLGALAGMMMWFYVTAYVVLLGAELNAQIAYDQRQAEQVRHIHAVPGGLTEAADNSR